MSQSDEDPSFFERERERLSREITFDFEELLSSTNGLNRKLEEVLGMTKEYTTIAALWSSFYQLMRGAGQDGEGGEEQTATVSGGSASNQPGAGSGR
ncbi:DASH complex subunit Dad1-domain-containing protein [Mycena epipterygia]|nr:DASH complex subunit Dad1-domain-containing protein [Mycena epipterygia]